VWPGARRACGACPPDPGSRLLALNGALTLLAFAGPVVLALVAALLAFIEIELTDNVSWMRWRADSSASRIVAVANMMLARLVVCLGAHGPLARRERRRVAATKGAEPCHPTPRMWRDGGTRVRAAPRDVADLTADAGASRELEKLHPRASSATGAASRS
jgi:hypothetical protein